MTYFEIQSDFTDQFFDILKRLFIFSSQRHSVTLRFSKTPWKKKFIDDAMFYLWWRHQQSSFWSANYAPVMWASQLLYRSSSFYNGHSRSRFQLHAMSGTWDTRGEGIYVSSILTIAYFLGFFACRQRVRKNKKDKTI